MRFKPFCLLFALAAAGAVLPPARAPLQARTPVTLVRLPDAGIQPQVAVDARGRLHVIYFRGEAAHGDLIYARLDDRGRFSAPLQVNTQPGAALATGTMRGGHLAMGRNSRVHVAWHGSGVTTKVGDSSPVLYTRLNDAGTRFEPEKNVVQTAVGLDGGTVAADAEGHVYVAWHAGLPGMKGEADRRVFVTTSQDDGRTFGPQTAASEAATGACGCCGVGALADARDGLFVLYRAATESVHRDTYLVRSRDRGATFSGTRLQEWNVASCPMSTFSLARGANGVFAAWETDGQVQWTRVDPATGQPAAVVTPSGSPRTRKHPSVAVSARGEVLLVWTEGTGWNKGGSLAWQLFDASGRPAGDPDRAPGVPTWSLAAAAARPDGSFVIVY